MEKINKIENFLNKTLTGLLVSVTPFTASVIPVIFLFVNLTGVMGMSWAAALPIAIAAEGVGVGSVAIFFKAVQFNKRYKDDRNHVNTTPAIVSYVIYLSAIIVTNALLEAQDWYNGIWQVNLIIQSLSRALLSLLSLSGALMIATNHAINLVVEKNQRTPGGKMSKTKRKLERTEADTKEIETDTSRTDDHKQDALPVYDVSERSELTAEMIGHLNNGHPAETLRSMFPNVTARTIRRWKADVKHG